MKIGVKMIMSGIVEGWDVVGRCLGVYYKLDRSWGKYYLLSKVVPFALQYSIILYYHVSRHVSARISDVLPDTPIHVSIHR